MPIQLQKLRQQFLTIEPEFPKVALLKQPSAKNRFTAQDTLVLRQILARHNVRAGGNFLWALISGGISIPAFGRTLIAADMHHLALPFWFTPAVALVVGYHGFRGWSFLRELWLSKETAQALKAVQQKLSHGA